MASQRQVIVAGIIALIATMLNTASNVLPAKTIPSTEKVYSMISPITMMIPLAVK